MSQRGNCKRFKGGNREKRLKNYKTGENAGQWSRSCGKGDAIKKWAMGYNTLVKKARLPRSLPSALCILVLGILRHGQAVPEWTLCLVISVIIFAPCIPPGSQNGGAVALPKVGLEQDTHTHTNQLQPVSISKQWTLRKPPCQSENLWTPRYSTPKYSLSM